MTNTPHILRSYDDALTELTAQTTQIAGMAHSNLLAVYDGLLNRNEAACLRAIADDEAVNSLERRIDASGIEIMTRYQPVARDLRRVLASMRVANNIERVSDEAKNIGRRTRPIILSGFAGGNDLIEPLFTLAIGEFRDAVQAFDTADYTLAATIRERDIELDSQYRAAVANLSDQLAASSKDAKDYLHLLFIARSIERVGDHAKNIAEETAFLLNR